MKRIVATPVVIALCLFSVLPLGCLTSTVSESAPALHGMLDTVIKDWLTRSPNLTHAEPRLKPGEIITLLSKGLPEGYEPALTEPMVIALPGIVRVTPQEKATIRIDRTAYAVSYHVLSIVGIKRGFRKTRITIGDNLHRANAGSQCTYLFLKKDGLWSLDQTGPVVLK